MLPGLCHGFLLTTKKLSYFEAGKWPNLREPFVRFDSNSEPQGLTLGFPCICLAAL